MNNLFHHGVESVRLKSTIHNCYALTNSVSQCVLHEFSTLIVVITAAEGGEKFWGPIKDRYWVLYHGGVGGCLGNLMYLRVGFRYSYVLKAYACNPVEL